MIIGGLLVVLKRGTGQWRIFYAGFIASFIFIAAGATTAQLAHSVRMPYAILAICAFAMAVITAFVQLPKVIEEGGVKSAS